MTSRASSFADDEESSRLMRDVETKEPVFLDSRDTPAAGAFTLRRLYISTLHVLVIGLAIALAFSHSRARSACIPTSGGTWSPAQQFVDYEVSKAPASEYPDGDPYVGPPTDESDAAWTKLIEPIYFIASREEMERAGESMQDAVKMVKGGYIAVLGVYHELHCLRQLRFWLYRDHYYPNITDAQDNYMHGHLDHCINALRRTIMCHGNTGVYTFGWHQGDNSSLPVGKTNSQSVCAKWSSIDEWANSRKISWNPDVAQPEDE
ncbi:Transacylase cctO-like protein [Cladobotryum mycophilum]|uniref:Transacylase cctO-like protein n=1 Tax=Cladobotryum mycophilum TaxID=491253 RepID=A0ABR0T4P2_9HYPO